MKASQRTFLVNISRRKIVISPRRKVCFCDKQVARTLYYYIMKLDENPWFAFNWKFIKLLPPATKTESQKMILTTRINRAISRVSTLKKLGLMRKILGACIILSGSKATLQSVQYRERYLSSYSARTELSDRYHSLTIASYTVTSRMQVTVDIVFFKS